MANSLVFIDSRVKDKDLLISHFSSGTTCLVLDADRDGIGQIVSVLTGLNGIDSIRIISFGAPGSILIGSNVLDRSSLDRYATELALIGDALHDNGDLLLYGCNVGAGDAGREFVERVSQMTGADVAASDDPTGGAVACGDWVLEVQSGVVESATEMPALSDYGFVLDNHVPVISGPLSLSVTEGATTATLNLLANASDADPGDTMRVGPVSYTVNGVHVAVLPGMTLDDNTLTFDPAISAYDSLAAGQQTTIVATFQVLDTSASTALSFAGKVRYAAGEYSASVTSGDVNGDGWLDLMVANDGSDTVSVLLNDGDGTFAPKVDYASGRGPFLVTSGDVNGDGWLDLMVANEGGNTVSVLLNDRDGTFAPKVDYVTGSYPFSVTSGDVNGDGWLDLMVANEGGNTVSVLLNDRDGTFAPKVDYATGRYPFSVTSCDVDGDSWLDLMVANQGSNTVSVFRNNGDGTFAPKEDYLTGIKPISVTSGDVDGHRGLDLMVANEFSHTVSVFLNNGDGTFAPKEDYPTGLEPVSVIIGDVNGDGWLDLIVSNISAGSVSVLLGEGAGAFLPKIDFEVSSEPAFMTSGDVNGDGKLDLMVPSYNDLINGGVSVLLNDSPGNPGYPETTATITIEGVNDLPVVSVPLEITVDEGDPSWSLDLLSHADDPDSGDTMHVGPVSYTVNGEPSPLPAGFSQNGNTLAFDPADPEYNSLAEGEQMTIIATFQVFDSSIDDLAFVPAVDYATGSGAWSVANGDLNGDGWLDLMVANQGSNTVSVLLGEGDGAFAPKVDYATGASPFSVTSGDVDGDGWLDLMVANESSNTVSVLFNQGDGTFAPKVDYATGLAPVSVTSGDVNGDSRLDLMVANEGSDTVSVLLNQGDGTFAPKVDFASGRDPFSVTSGDVNGDGKLDLIVTNRYYFSNTISVLMNQGDGTFSSKVDWLTGYAPFSVTSGDVDGDGFLDLMVANEGSNTVSVLLNDGDGIFAPKVDYETGSDPVSVTTGDMNGDGWLDLMVSNHNGGTVSVLLNHGDGTFAPKIDFDAGRAPGLVTGGDVNGDGLADLMVADYQNGTVSVLLNDSPGNAGYPTTTATITIEGVNDLPVVIAPHVSTLYENGPYYALSLLEGSEDPDGDWLHAGPVSYTVNGVPTDMPTGVSETGILISFNPSDPLYQTLAEGEETTIVATWQVFDNSKESLAFAGKVDYEAGEGALCVANGDINGDDLVDLIIANEAGNTVSLLLNNGDGTYAPKEDYATGLKPVSLTIGDVNGDSCIDLIVANEAGNMVSVLLNNGNGTYAPKEDYATGLTPGSLTSGDVNGDGCIDLIVANEAGNTVSVLINNGNGTYAPKEDYATGLTPGSLTSGDVNGDGCIDLIVANEAGNTVSVLINNGDGTYAPKKDYATGLTPGSLTIVDLNRDYRGDLIVANQGSDTVSVLRNRGDGTFEASVGYETGIDPSSVTVEDLNSDALPDLIVANKGSNTVSVLLNMNDGFFYQKVDYETGAAPSSVMSGDVNGDRRIDLIVTASDSSSVSVLLNHGDGTFLSKVDLETGSAPGVVSGGDVNSDGLLDLMVTDRDNGLVSVLVNESPANPDYPITTATITIAGINDLPVVTSPFVIMVDEGESELSLDLLSNAADVDSGDILLIGAVSYTVNGEPSPLPAGFTLSGNTLAIDPADPGYESLAEGEQRTIVATWQVSDSAETGQLSFSDGVEYVLGRYLSDIADGDLNGDGSIDIVVANWGSDTVSVMLNNGDGSYAPSIDYASENSPCSVIIGDVTRDGMPDLLVANRYSDAFSVLVNHGDGTFAPKVDYLASGGQYAMASEDVNQDGWLDLMVAYGEENMVSIFLNQGDGTFGAHVDYATGLRPYSMTSGDINGDGWSDLAIANWGSDTVSVLMNNGNGTFATSIDYEAGQNPSSLISADLNGDGCLDLIFIDDLVFLNPDPESAFHFMYSSRNKVSVLLNQGNGTFASKVDYEPGNAVQWVRVGDVNADGFSDLIVSMYDSSFGDATESVALLLNKGDGTFGPILYHETGISSGVLMSNDLDGDGWFDLVIAEYSGDTLSVLINNSAVNPGYPAATATITIEGTNDKPALTTFGGMSVTTPQGMETPITFEALRDGGDESDIDGVVEAFVVRSLMSGTLRIGADAASATPWNASTNNTIDSSHIAFWTPAMHTSGILHPFAVVARDNDDALSTGQVFVTVNVTSVINGTDWYDHLVGNSLDDAMYGYGGNDMLYGNGGNDLLDGGSGADRMEGGQGNDVYVVDNSGDVVKEYAGAGIDTVHAGVTYALVANVENLVLTGSNAINGKGNVLSNVITGNDGPNVLNGATGADTISGGGGNDTINGGTGVDVMSGGDGNDRFVFDYLATSEGGIVSKSHDIITDFVSSLELIDLSAIDANIHVPGNQSFSNTILSGDSTFTSVGQLRFDSVTGLLSGNTDSNLLTAEITVELSGVSSLTVGDFVF